MKTRKKTGYKEYDLVDALKKAASKKPTAAQKKARLRLNDALEDGIAVYDQEFDAYYNKETGQWLEKRCRSKDCQFCANRPRKKKL